MQERAEARARREKKAFDRLHEHFKQRIVKIRAENILDANPNLALTQRKLDMLPETLPAEVCYGYQDSCLEDDDDESIMRFVILPPQKNGCQPRLIEITCSIFLKHYRVGDYIVTAAIKDGCPHAFHESCITEWLIRGNMRCPVCRRWFDSPSNIKNLKEALRGQSVETESNKARNAEYGRGNTGWSWRTTKRRYPDT